MSKDELAKLRAVLEHAPGFIALCDLDANILYINRVAYGYKMEDTLGASYYDFLGPEQATLIREAFAALRATGEEQSVEYQLDTPEGGRRHLVSSIAGHHNAETGELEGFINVVADVTARRVAEERVAELEAARAREELAREVTRGELVLDTMMDGYMLMDEVGHIVACNDATAALFEQPRQSIIGSTLENITREIHPSFEDHAPTFENNDRSRFDAWFITHGGQRVEARVAVAALDMDDQRLFVGIIHDVTEQNRAAREHHELVGRLQQQHRLHSLGTLAGGAAHEINNPIQSIISFSELIKRRGGGNGLEQFADEILSEAHRIAKIVRNLSTFARADTEKHSPARFSDIVESSLGLLRHALARDGIGVDVTLPDNLPLVKCRSQQIRQIVLNVLSNARDALNAKYDGHHDDKQLAISAETFEQGSATWIRLTVEDHGEGIAAENLPHVFDPFFTTRQESKRSGLGLAVSHGIATEHHGNLRIESKPNEPTRVHLELRVDNGWNLEA